MKGSALDPYTNAESDAKCIPTSVTLKGEQLKTAAFISLRDDDDGRSLRTIDSVEYDAHALYIYMQNLKTENTTL